MTKASLLLLVACACTNDASLGHSTSSVTPPALGGARWAMPLAPGDIVNETLFAGDHVIVAGENHPSETAFGGLLASFRADDGTLEWRLDLADHSEIQASAVAANGDIVVCGSFQDTIDAGGVVLSAPPETVDLFVARYTSAGRLRWARAIEPTSSATGLAVAVASDDTIYVGGWFRGVVDVGNGPVGRTTGWETQGDGLLVAYAGDGTPLWGRTFVGAGAAIEDIAALPGGDAIVTGTVNDGVSLGGDALHVPGLARQFLARFAPSGDHVWSRLVDTDPATAVTYAGRLTALADGDLVVTREETSERPDPLTANLATLERFSPDGTSQWIDRTPGASSLFSSASNGIVFSGGEVKSSHSTIGPGPMYLVAHDATAAMLDQRSFGPTVAVPYPLYLGPIAASPAGALAFVASLDGPTDFGTGMMTPSGLPQVALVMLAPADEPPQN